MGTVLTDTDQIPANETISVFFRGALGPLTGADTASSEIIAAFNGSSFVVEKVNIPTLSEIEPPDVVGHFEDYDGAGHSLPGRNMFVSEFNAFFLNRMQTVSGLYFAAIDKIETGSQISTLLSTSTSLWLWLVVIVAGLVAVAWLTRG